MPRRPLCALTAVQSGACGEGLHAAADLARRERDNSVRGLRVRGAPESIEGGGEAVDGQAVVFAVGGRVRLLLPDPDADLASNGGRFHRRVGVGRRRFAQQTAQPISEPSEPKPPMIGRAMRFPITLDLLTCCRVVVMLAPSYAAAYLTSEMVWTVPTLAAASVLAANLKAPESVTRSVDRWCSPYPTLRRALLTAASLSSYVGR